ncbi:MAG: hypothetical protein ACI8ZF_000527 [Candidatus Midichloriaceae bacterium]|jgi:hypothetical protein
MDILDEVKEDLKKEKATAFINVSLKYFAYLILIFLVSSAIYYWWSERNSNIIFEQANAYNEAIYTTKKEDFLEKMESLSRGGGVYSQLANLSLAGFYIKDKNYNRAIHNYENIINQKGVSDIYRDYAKLMMLKTKVFSGKLNDDILIKEFQEYIDNGIYFKSYARIIESTLLIREKRNNEASSTLNHVITDSNTPVSLINIAKIIKSDLNEDSGK